MVSDLISLSSSRTARLLALSLTGVLIAAGVAVAPDPVASAGVAAGSRTTSVQGAARHAGAPKFKTPKRRAAKQRQVETYTPVSHSVSDGERTRTTLFGAPAFKQVDGRWKKLSSRISQHRGRYPLRANRVAVPTWFGATRSSLMRIRSGGGGLNVSLVGAAGRHPRVTKRGRVPRISYSSVMPGVDLTYDVGHSSTKERIVLRDARAPRSYTFLIKDRKHSLGTPQRTGREAVEFRDDVGGGFTMSLAEPVANGPTSRSGKGAKSSRSDGPSAHQKVTRTPDGYRVRVWLDRSWARGRGFPLVLDPTIVYSWDEETLATAYGPDQYCNMELLASSLDGSGYVGLAPAPCASPFDYEFFATYVHANLSNIPPWTEINSATMNLGWDPIDANNCFTMAPHGVNNLLTAGDSWDDAEMGEFGGGTFDATSGTVGGFDEYASDVTDPVRYIVENGLGSQAGFKLKFTQSCSRQAARGKRDDDKRPIARDLIEGDGGVAHDVSITIDYDGPILPPPIPVAQTYGCDCSWYHGSDVVSRVGGRVGAAAGQSMERVADLTQRAPGVPMTVARTYNGGDDTDGPLGVGWTHDFNASLTENPTTGDVVFRNPTGGQAVYHPLTGGAYVGDPGVTGKLVELGGGGWTATSLIGETLTFDADGRLASDVDSKGRGVVLGYSGSGPSARLSTITDEAGQVTTLTYGTSGPEADKIVEVETDDNRSVTYGYTTVAGDPHLTAVVDAAGETTEIDYDSSSGRLTQITDPTAGEHSRNVYDGAGRIIEQTDANGQTTTFDWQPVTGTGIPDGSGFQITTDPLGHVTKDLYYGNVLIKHTDHDGNITHYTYDSDLNVTAITDPLGYVTTMTYDSAGNLLSRTGPDPSAITETWTYNAENQATSYTDGRGKTTAYGYDVSGQLETVTDPLNHATSYSYDGDGNLASVTSPEGRLTEYDYDAQGNLITQTSPSGNAATFDYDDAGNLTSQTTPRGNELGAIPADYTSTYTYDDAGRLLTATDPAGTVTTHTYDESGRVMTTVTVDDQSDITADLAHTYDAAGNLLTTESFARTTLTRTYDERGQIASSTDAEGHTTTYAYDYAGRLASTTSPRGNEPGGNPSDHTTSYAYDQAGNLYATATPYVTPFGVNLGYTYRGLDENDRAAAITTPAYRTSYTTYDDAGNILTTTDPIGRVTTRTYDDDGRLAGIARPDQDPTHLHLRRRRSSSLRNISLR